MSDIEQETVQDRGVWKRLMRNYAVALVLGVALLAYVMPQLHENASRPMMAAQLFGGLLVFGGGFGVVVALFFHYLNKNK